MLQHGLAEVNTLVRPDSENTCICLSRVMLWIKPAGLESLKPRFTKGCRNEMINFILKV